MFCMNFGSNHHNVLKQIFKLEFGVVFIQLDWRQIFNIGLCLLVMFLLEVFHWLFMPQIWSVVPHMSCL